MIYIAPKSYGFVWPQHTSKSFDVQIPKLMVISYGKGKFWRSQLSSVRAELHEATDIRPVQCGTLLLGSHNTAMAHCVTLSLHSLPYTTLYCVTLSACTLTYTTLLCDSQPAVYHTPRYCVCLFYACYRKVQVPPVLVIFGKMSSVADSADAK